MALYFGNSKSKLYFYGTSCVLNICPSNLILNGTILESANGYILKDINGLYLTAKEDE